MRLMLADLVLIIPNHCKALEEGSWEWWLRGCWLLTPTAAQVTATVLPALFVGALLVMASRQPRVK